MAPGTRVRAGQRRRLRRRREALYRLRHGEETVRPPRAEYGRDLRGRNVGGRAGVALGHERDRRDEGLQRPLHDERKRNERQAVLVLEDVQSNELGTRKALPGNT